MIKQNTHSQPLGKDRTFVGHETLFSLCERAIKRSEHLSIVGGAASGKTALLRQVKAWSIENGVNAAYLDCTSIASPRDFVQRLAQQLGEAGHPGSDRERLRMPHDEGELFSFLEELGGSVTLLLDNLCVLPRNTDFKLDFWRTLRGIATDRRLRISVIATSAQLLRDCFPTDPSSSDFWNIFAVQFLTQSP